LVIALLDRLGIPNSGDQNPESTVDDHAKNIKKWYKVEDIFKDIEGDPDNVLMNIPPEINEYLDLKEGDTVDVTTEDNSIKLKKVDNASG